MHCSTGEEKCNVQTVICSIRLFPNILNIRKFQYSIQKSEVVVTVNKTIKFTSSDTSVYSSGLLKFGISSPCSKATHFHSIKLFTEAIACSSNLGNTNVFQTIVYHSGKLQVQLTVMHELTLCQFTRIWSTRSCLFGLL